jgi:predicted GNAT family acetyltransferase
VHQRLYALGTLLAPEPPPPGRPRQAVESDLDITARWVAAFHSETGSPGVDVESVVRDRILNGLLHVWEDADGKVVSMAGRNRTAALVARVGPVYTPPEHRRHGYGAAVTAACTSDALRHDADDVVLFTDLANPTTNAIYQQIGFRPLRDHKLVHFNDERQVSAVTQPASRTAADGLAGS